MIVANSVLVTAENWFELPHLLRSSGSSVSLDVAGPDAPGSLARVPLDELRAVHQTLGAWWAELRSEEYDRLLSASRALVRRSAEAVLASEARMPDDAAPAADQRLYFPALEHPLLSDDADAVTFLRGFFVLSHSSSLLAWARELAGSSRTAEACLTRVWLRLLLQKAAAEDDLAEAFSCLRSVYAGRDEHRRELLAAEADLLERCGMGGFQSWSRARVLDRPARTEPAFAISGRRTTGSPSDADVTVLIPSYRHGEYIERAIESVLAQSYSRWRVLVVDDRSPDDTVERASRTADPRVRVQVNDTNLGLGNSVLRALESIDTPYVALLNSDDLFHPERLERCIEALERSHGAQLAVTDIVTIDDRDRRIAPDTVSRLFDGPRIDDWIRWFAAEGHPDEDADIVAELLRRNFLISSSNVVCRTGFLRDHAESLRGLEYCLDWQLFLDAAIAGTLRHVRGDLLGYRLHGSNTVWFDEDRGRRYKREVNRVLAQALGELVRQSGSAARSSQNIIALVENYAARHSEADGVALFTAALLRGGPDKRATATLSDVPARVQAAVATPDGGDAEAGERRSGLLRHAALASASRALAEVFREERDLAVAAEQALRQEQQRRDVENDAERIRIAEEKHRIAEDFRHQRERAEREQQRKDGERAAIVEAEAAAERLAHAQEVARLKRSPEWLVGDLAWNRAGVSRIARPAARAIRTVRDRRNRSTLAAGRAARRWGLARPRAVVAACWNFPIYSQTFVYQEIKALALAGLDYRVFCCGTNPRTELHPAFEQLWRNRVVLESDWSFNRADFEYFTRMKPDRVEALLARLGEATGRTRESLLGESIVMMGFTFARHVELSGAAYIHTYFFYDQSLMALMAAYLLKIPRGITSYADHMLADYPFKCVPLHLELADIVVATSRRIRDELSAIGEGRFDAKIIVKPNGIDTRRFPYVEAGTRLEAGGVPELIAVNRIEPKKGLIHLVDAMGLLKARGVAARLNIVGGADPNTPSGAECFTELQARIDRLQLADSVILHGVKQQQEFAPLLARARIFVAPYVEVASGDKDGIPTAVLEAMSTGLPVVFTDAGSLVEAVGDGVEGVRVPQRDAGALAAAIERLLTDRSMYARTSEAARNRAVSEFDMHVTEKRLHERIGMFVRGPVR